MRELHVVAVSEDGRHVLLVGRRGATRPAFKVALDDKLAQALRGDLPAPGTDVPISSDLSPKEIQARLRTGESAEAIAFAAGVPVARVERFSGPVQGEMARMIDAARDSYVVRGRLGRSAVPLGAAVDAALAASPSLVEESVDWSTRREESGSWLITVAWNSRKKDRTASWRYDPAQKVVTAADPASAALAHVETAAPKKRTAAAAPAKKAPAKKVPAKKVPAKKVPAKKVPAKKVPAKKVPAKKVPVQKAVAEKAPAKKAVATKAPVRKAPVRKAPAKKAAAPTKTATRTIVKKAPARPVPAKRPVARPAPAKARLRVVPDPAPTKRTTAADRDGVKTRASVPGWADVLLGTTPGSDR